MKINKNFTLISSLFFGIIASSATYAVQFSIEDVSNQVITCDSPLLGDNSSGHCLIYPEDTFFVTATLDEGDEVDTIDNLHIIVSDKKDGFFEYNSNSAASHSNRWKKIPKGSNDDALLLTSSFARLPFETKAIGRQINFNKFIKKKGSKIFLGVRSNKSTGFMKNATKEVFEVR